MQRRREPNSRGDVAVAACALPHLRVDVAEAQLDALDARTMEARVIPAPRRRDVELRFVPVGRSEIKLPEHRQRIERRQLEAGGLVAIEQYDAGLPIESRRFVAAVAAALRRVEIGLQPGARDRTRGGQPPLAAQEQRCQAARFADAGDRVTVVAVLEPIDRIADKEALRPEKSAIDELDTRR